MYLTRAMQVRPAASFSFFDNFRSLASNGKERGRNNCQLFAKRNFTASESVSSNSKMSDSIISSVSQNDDSILQEVLDLVRKEKLLCDAADSGAQKVVEFVHPKELEKCLGGLEIGTEPSSRDEVKEFMESVVRYSVKTCHHRFYNQVKKCGK